ncbi:MAG: ABC transporter ATP-binding protein [Terrisporobacter othiniensis]|uniref:ABC transporter ATP-binding protein YxlF n=1 Tax=Terrisporobacter petrolearius TaxID=1460447 RepID=A0ABZ3FL63_9FIRM|nr:MULTISPECIES: ABC transporter ATP-binding protein [Terrisporobacter]MBN9648880.1 ABC transporter ATP-binding protein [Terrisporobacter glycolicus]MDU4861993.1 ABC transporter ATP-binding protein [Terrisporobacter othiniensis]MDU6995629.1 ABC transporter ATP-binding protein [Terrisporobacter othiniensis]HBI92212.1 ABC transporter ATP-binding protein [Terrisporobacter hibernicus]
MELIIKNISKEFKDKIAVDKFSVTLSSGIYGLLGPNGSGKTTLMRILADVSSASSGDILVNGESKNKLGAEYRDLIGYVPQNIGFYKNFTAEKFLYYVAALKGVDKNIEKSKIDELLKFVNLEQDRKRRIGKFSGGMKQRLGIAQALLNDPKILILDEPTAGLDPNERIRFKNLIAQLSKGKIVILSTHIVSDIEFIANEVLVMKDGKLVEKSSLEEILDTVRGKVYTLSVNECDLDEVENKFKISSMIRNNSGINVRVVGDKKPNINKFKYIEEEPNLEDVFLYYFNESVSI